MGMMGAPGPYGSAYGQCGGQSLGPQLQNKAGQPNSINQFNLNKKPQHGQNMGGMVRELYRNHHSEPHPHTFPDPDWGDLIPSLTGHQEPSVIISLQTSASGSSHRHWTIWLIISPNLFPQICTPFERPLFVKFYTSLPPFSVTFNLENALNSDALQRKFVA